MTEKITKADIDRVKREFIQRTLLLKATEVAVMLGRSTRTVFRLIEEGHLTAVNPRPGSPTMVPASSVEEYQKKNVAKEG